MVFWERVKKSPRLFSPVSHQTAFFSCLSKDRPVGGLVSNLQEEAPVCFFQKPFKLIIKTTKKTLQSMGFDLTVTWMPRGPQSWPLRGRWALGSVQGGTGEVRGGASGTPSFRLMQTAFRDVWWAAQELERWAIVNFSGGTQHQVVSKKTVVWSFFPIQNPWNQADPELGVPRRWPVRFICFWP